MNVTKEMTGDLTAVLKIDVTAADYTESVEKELKEYRRKANMPGFRPGQVPMGIVRKMYEKSVCAEQVQKLMTDAMYKYIEDNKLDILGNPMANNEKTQAIDWDNQKDFTFYFDIALQPEFQLDLNSQDVTYYDIVPTEEMLNKFVEDIQRRFGKFESPETIEETDLVYGEIEELDENGNVKEGGIKVTTSLAVDLISMVTIKKKFIGAKKDDVITFNLAKAFKNTTEIASMLRIDKEQAKQFKSDVNFKVTGISRVIKHELNEELFEMAYKGKGIKTEEDFRKAAKEDLCKTYSNQADRYFMDSASKALIENTKMDLPDEFLKRWLVEINQGKVDSKEILDNYDKYRDSIKWQLIEGKLVDKYKLEVSGEEVKDYYKTALVRNYFPVPEDATEEQIKETEEAVEKVATNMLENKEQSRQVYEYLFEDKLIKALKADMKHQTKQVDTEEFAKIIKS